MNDDYRQFEPEEQENQKEQPSLLEKLAEFDKKMRK